MRIKGKYELVPYQGGKINLIADTLEDLWALYNIISAGDYIKMAMYRKVQHETGSKITSTKKKLIITIQIEEIDYSEDVIRLKGKNVSPNEYIAIGQYQTTEISIGSFFTLLKNYWDEIHLETLKNVTDVTKTSEIATIIMEEGVAHLYYINNNQTVLKGKVTHSIPKKRNGSTQHDKGKEAFFEKILNQLVKQINFENTKVLIIASPGFTKDDFKKYMESKIENNKKEFGELKNNLNKIIYTHSSSGYKHSIEEVLSNQEIKHLIKNTKCLDDCVVMERFNEILGKDMDKIFFGLKAFNIAYEKKAIDTVIVTDTYLRKISPTVRKELAKKLKELKNSNTTEVCQFSSQHTTGEKIDEFGGICGIMRYVVQEVVDLGNEEENNEESLDVSSKKSSNLKDENKNENLIELINDNLTNYNIDGNEEDQKDDEEGGKKYKKKKSKDLQKSKAQQRKKQKRKRSSFNNEEDEYDDDNF